MQQHLIFDADDTLWENNVFYEAAIEAFIDFVNHPSLTRQQVRAAVDQAELANIRRYGYGAANFERSLVDCLCKLRGLTSALPEHTTRIARLCRAVHDCEMVLIEGVEATLADLADRHSLYLLTKGAEQEQREKIARSGLAHHFTATVVVPEKTPDAYRTFTARHALPANTTWMIGNSLRSDINPALACGLGAVFVPHPQTWALEDDRAPEASERFLIVQRFGQLSEVF